MNPTMPATKPELRHFPAHHLAILWACPHDHEVLRLVKAEDDSRDFMAGRFAGTAAERGLYSCGVHGWLLGDERQWEQAADTVSV